MSNYFPLLRQWVEQSKLSTHQKEVYEKHLICAEVLPLPGPFTYSVGTMEFTGKARSAERQLIVLGLIKKLGDNHKISSAIFRLAYPQSMLISYGNKDIKGDDLISILCGPIDELSTKNKLLFRDWLMYSTEIPMVKGL